MHREVAVNVADAGEGYLQCATVLSRTDAESDGKRVQEIGLYIYSSACSIVCLSRL